VLDESKLIPTIYIDSTLFKKIRTNSQALACINSELPFILLKDFKTQTNPNNQEYIRTNLAHESSYIFTKYLRDSGIMKTNDSDIDMGVNFLTFLDEFVCKLTGKEFPGGYTKLRESNSVFANHFKEENPEKFEEIQSMGGDLNRLLRELGLKMISKGIDLKILIGAIICTQNFEELKASIIEFDLELNRIPNKATKQTAGWGAVNI
jgi:hypothetical protein